MLWNSDRLFSASAGDAGMQISLYNILLEHIVVHDKAVSNIGFDRINLIKSLGMVNIQAMCIVLVAGEINRGFAKLLGIINRPAKQQGGQSLSPLWYYP